MGKIHCVGALLLYCITSQCAPPHHGTSNHHSNTLQVKLIKYKLQWLEVVQNQDVLNEAKRKYNEFKQVREGRQAPQ